MSSAQRVVSAQQYRWITGVVLLFLVYLTALLQQLLQTDGALDIDAINFGLAAHRFSLIEHQPHPPGYPAYVLLLKLIHTLLPHAGPLTIASWGSRLCGLLLVPALFFATRHLLNRSNPAQRTWRALYAASLAAFHPALVYYGSDGQSHAAEALVTLLLFWGTLATAANHTRVRLFSLVVAFGLAGAVRPTIALLNAPLLLWLFWRQPRKHWLSAGLIGGLTVAAWFVPLVLLSGGWQIYRRASEALFGELYLANYSLFGARATAHSIATNLNLTLWGVGYAALPLLCWCRGQQQWKRPWFFVVALNVLFYALIYTAEVGYFSAVTALCCLVPASWPAQATGTQRLRQLLLPLIGLGLLLFAPAQVPIYRHSPLNLPSLNHTRLTEAGQQAYTQLLCGSAAGKAALVFADNLNVAHERLVPLVCPNVQLALYVGRTHLNPKLDNLLIFRHSALVSLPTKIPLEVGPAATHNLDAPFTYVMLAPDASPWLDQRITDQATCQRHRQQEQAIGTFRVKLWPASCLSQIQLGQNRLRLLRR